MGLGALAWNPVVESLKNIDHRSIRLERKKNQLMVTQNQVVLWEISEKIFEPGYMLNLIQSNDRHLITATGLIFKNTLFHFSLKADICLDRYAESQVSIPEFGINWKGSFIRWIEKIESIKGTGNFQEDLIYTGEKNLIQGSGVFEFSLSPDWTLQLKSNNQIVFHIDGKTFHTGKCTIDPACVAWESFFRSAPKVHTHVILPEFSDWKNFVSEINLNEGKFTFSSPQNPDIHLALIRNNQRNPDTMMWITQQSGMEYFPEQICGSRVVFDRFFYYAEFLKAAGSSRYISAVLPENGQWVINSLGSFKFEKNQDFPDFEAYGYGNHFDRLVFESRLRAFKPEIGQATTLSSVWQDPPKVRIIQPQRKVTTRTVTTTEQKEEETQQPARNSTDTRQQPVIPSPDRVIRINTETERDQNDQKRPPSGNTTITPQTPREQQPVRQIQQNQPRIQVEFDKLKFKPKNALSIIVLRPEDLVLLEFVFHNFNFTNKGQSPYLELDNEKETGVVEIYFQTQHTLEEAFFESANIPDPDPLKPTDTGVRLPAKHLRAGKSRLVYELPAGHAGFPLIMDELLDWSKFTLRVHPRAWIKMPAIRPVRKPVLVLPDTKNRIPVNQNLKYLDTPSTEYGVKLAGNTRVSAGNLQVYQENEITKVLPPVTATSVKSAFNPQTIKKISWKVEPIPDLSTSIEAPALLYISPNQTNDFTHKTTITFRDVEELRPKTQVLDTQLRVLDPLFTQKGEITELWHTRLGVKLKNGKTSSSVLSHLKTIRALWAHDADPDYKVAKERNYPFMASLDANNRQKLVHTTSNYSAGFEPFPVPVNDLMLTSLGAYIDWHAFFDVPNPQDTYLNIIEWEHIATLGRDHYVKIVEEGYLFPFGHRAAVVKITERKFHQQTKAAVNRQRMFVVVLEKEVLYNRNDPEGKFIAFPFQAIRILTGSTPDIDDPQNSTLVNVPSGSGITSRLKISAGGNSGGNTTYNFYINTGGKGFLFDISGTDKEGRNHFFRMPLAFMENRIARDKNLMQQVINVYRGKSADGFNKVYNEADFSGQEVAYAEFLVEGDTEFETRTVKFDAQIWPVNGEGEPKFHPAMKEAKIFVRQISELTGLREPTTITLEDDNNKGGVFAKVISSNVVDFSGGSDKSGGFLVPNMSVSGLSKLQGPVSGNIDDIKELQFIPEDFFKAFEDLPVAKIFGVIDIISLLFGSGGSPFDLGGSFDDMIDAVQGLRKDIEDLKNEILYLENLKKETQQAVEDQINQLKALIKQKVSELITAINDSIPRIPNLKAYLTEEAFYAEYKWQPQLGGEKMEVIPGLLNVNVNDPAKALTITTKFEKPFDSSIPASMNGVARFEKFEVDIVPLLAVKFNYLEFRTGSSQKTDVKVDIDKNDPIAFKGVLNFVNNLQSVIPTGGFSDDGPFIDLKPTGITAGFNISIPNIEVGICMISNISLGASVTLPFTGAPLTIGFNFCRRENPFMLTISCFGGGGYFMMVTTLKGIQSIEAAFEFGAAMSLNVGVASGGVSAMGGFYYKMEIVEGVEQTTLTGYLRLNGHLSILGLISLSLEFYLAFIAVIYQGKVQKLEGVATLKVKVEVLFFSKTVSVSVRRELKGADADPKFMEMIDQDDWQEYCLAFVE